MYRFKNLSDDQLSILRFNALVENSNHHQRKLEAAERAAFEKSAQDEENSRLLEKHRAERMRELAAEVEARRREGAAQFEQDLRQRFFAGNPNLTESDFKSVLPRMREEAMLANAQAQIDSEGRVRGTGSYVPM